MDVPTSGARDAQCFTYDGLRRLTRAWTPASGSCASPPSGASLGGPAPYGFTDTFDAVGNRTARTTYAAGGNTTHTYAYPAAGSDGAHTLTSVRATGPAGTTTSTYGYDDAGNTTTRAVAGAPAQTLTWDVEGELAALAEAGGATDSYLYSADGERLIRRQDGATTVYLPGGMELTLAGGQVKATRYYSFNGQTIAVRTGIGNANVWTLVPDRHGTAQLAIQNSTSTLTRRYTDPYGNPRGTAPPRWTGDHGFLDKPTDTTGLTQIGARYYDPAIARFISVDPIMDLTDPQQWHGYAYANNNPITWADPTGLRPKSHDGGTSKGKYVPAPPKPQGKALKIELEEILDSHDPRGYMDRVDSLTDDERQALVDADYYDLVQLEYSNQSQIAIACELNGGCTPCEDDACVYWNMFLMVASVGGAPFAFAKLAEWLLPARATVGPPPPGAWTSASESMSARAAAYQEQVTGATAGSVYRVGGVNFDGFAQGVLLEAKGPGYATFVRNGEFMSWFRGADTLANQAIRQTAAAGGRPITWSVAEPQAATAIENLFASRGITGINIVHVPAG